MRSLRLAWIGLGLGMVLAGCASTPDSDTFGTFADSTEAIPRVETPSHPMQCAPYARERSGIDIHGDAAVWWDLAAGHYGRSRSPSIGSVLVLTGYASRHRGHVAVVTAITSDREIRVDHANWFGDGNIYRNDPVVDVSPNNDWSAVRVWDTRDNVLGLRVYSVKGFILPDDNDENTLLASGS